MLDVYVVMIVVVKAFSSNCCDLFIRSPFLPVISAGTLASDVSSLLEEVWSSSDILLEASLHNSHQSPRGGYASSLGL